MQLGAYTIEREVGRGGAGTVYLARGPRGERVAVKTLRLESARDAASRERSRGRFLREIQTVLALADVPGVVPVLDAGSSPDGMLWLAMPFLGGGTLRARLKKGPLGVEAAVSLVRSLAGTLGAAHARGIVHRDVKPENVLFTDAGEPRVADLGLAKAFDEGAAGTSRGLSRTGDAHGTIGYMAPECLDDSKHARPASDVFALGAILFEALAGAPAFPGATALEVVAAVALGRTEPLARRCPEAPPWLVAIVERALAVDPEDRFADGHELAAALGARAAPAVSTRARGGRPALALALGLAVALVLVASAGGVALLLRRAPAPSPAPSSGASATPRPGPSVSPRRTLDWGPAWFRELPDEKRPALPLPAGLAPSDTPLVYRHERDGSELVFVPRGPCLVGNGEDEGPLETVRVRSFFVGRTEVTNAQWRRFADRAHYETTAEKQLLSAKGAAYGVEIASGYSWKRPFEDTPASGPDPRCPVVYVSWLDARAYCDWAGLRLLSSEEWEKAAAWDPEHEKHRAYSWGDDLPGPGKRYGNVAVERTTTFAGRPTWLDQNHKGDFFRGYDHGCAYLAPVGSFPDGASFYGALDMTGNAAEWIDHDVSGLQGHRGGSFWQGPYMCLTRAQPGEAPDHAHDWVGFRVALSSRDDGP